MSNDLWRWADPDGQQRRVRLDELRAALAGGHIAPNTPVWRSGWQAWQSAHEVPELTSSALSAANGVVPNIPPPPLAMVAVQHEFEAKSGGASFPPPAPDGGGGDEPPPPPRYVPLPVKANSIPPAAGSSGRLPSIGPRGAGSPSAPPSADRAAQHAGPHVPSSLPTTIGLPAPPEMLALAQKQQAAAQANGGGSKDPMIEELSGSMLLDDSHPAPAPRPGAGGLPPPTDPVLNTNNDGRPSLTDGLEDAGLPRRRPGLSAIFADFEEIKAGRQPKNKLLLAVVGVLALCVFVSLLAIVVSLFRGSPSELPSAGSSGSGTSTSSTSTSSGAGTSATGTSGTSAATGTGATPSATAAATTPKEDPKPAPAEGALGDCTLAGEAHVVSPRAFGQSGVEAVTVPGAIALGFAVDARNGIAVTVDPASIGITTTVRARALGGDARRMSPVLDKGKLTLVPGVDKKIDKLQGRRVVATNPPIDVGVAENALVWAAHDQNSWAKLFAVDGDGAIDAIRAVPLGGTKGIAVAFRRGNAIYVGAAKGDSALTPEGSLARIAGLGQVGSPAITTSGDNIIVAWSDRASAQDSWQIRWTKLKVGGDAAPASQLAIPDGGLGVQAMSPSLAGIGGGRFVITWSEGTPTHQVRAITLGEGGSPSGSAIALSAAGVNAGQPQVAIGPDGRGVIAFLALKGKAYEIHATPITCPAK